MEKIQCPYCWHEHKSAYIDCDECGEKSLCTALCDWRFEIHYSNLIIPCKNGNPHNLKFNYNCGSYIPSLSPYN